jgi:membrane protease YdiL (CAAX protease family)
MLGGVPGASWTTYAGHGMARDAKKSIKMPSADSYGRLSAGPLHGLLFLLPLVIVYEIGLVVYLSSRDGTIRETILAHRTLSKLFEAFGSTSLYLPGVLLIAVLLVWHVFTKRSWKPRPGVLVGMTCESLLWMVPLLVLGLITSMSLTGQGPQTPAPAAMMTVGGGEGWQSKVVLSIGAGLYEEMLFRLVLITMLHLIFHDALRLPDDAASVLAVIGSAVAFTIYHDVSYFGGSPFSHVFFYTAAGVYFGVVFLMRGLGIVVGAHAAYDIMALVVIPAIRG